MDAGKLSVTLCERALSVLGSSYRVMRGAGQSFQALGMLLLEAGSFLQEGGEILRMVSRRSRRVVLDVHTLVELRLCLRRFNSVFIPI
jgi:hypothetical protein